MHFNACIVNAYFKLALRKEQIHFLTKNHER